MASEPPLRRIRKIEFGVLSQDDILDASVCKVDVTTIYSKSLPQDGGLNDVRLGTVDRRINCATCGHSVVTCNGHTGHHPLAAPVYHPCFVDKVYKLLKMCCYFCSALLVSTEGIPDSVQGHDRFVIISGRINKAKRLCPKCDAPQPLYSCPRQGAGIKCDWPDKSLEALLPEERQHVTGIVFGPYRAWLILRAMTEADVVALGFNPRKAHPEAFIMRTLLIPAPCIRPSIMVTEGSRSIGLDDLTRMLQDVMKVNLRLERELERAMLARSEALTTARAAVAANPDNPELVATASMEEQRAYLAELSAPCPAVEEKLTRLQSEINVYFVQEGGTGNGRMGGSGASKGRNLAHRLKGKEGRVRGNLNGKRVNQSARTVISPEAELDVHELGIPPHVALTLTVTEIVCPINHQALTHAVRLGPQELGGAKTVVTRAGDHIRLDMCRDRHRLVLAYGDKVERHVRDGDWGVFNRQPSLHKLSLIGLKLRIVKGKTFRLSVPVTTGFNADFDGKSLLSTGSV